MRYTGKEAHASAFPERGINAADALTVAQTAIGCLRQHIRQTDRIHGIVTHGGDAPNIVPAHTAAQLHRPRRTLDELDEIRGEGGALLRGRRARDRLRRWRSTRSTSSPTPRCEARRRDGGRLPPQRRGARPHFLAGARPLLERLAGSTDMGNISLAMPSIHPMIGIDSLPAVNHQPEFTAHCATPVADRAVMTARSRWRGRPSTPRGREGAPAPTGRQHRVSQSLGRTET